MNTKNATSVLVPVLALASYPAIADDPPPPPTQIGCPAGSIAAGLSLELVATTSIDPEFQPTCPLLEDRELRKLVNKFGAGTTFAHPAIPYTCLSGEVMGGTLELPVKDQPPVIIGIDPAASYSESAQRLFPVPSGQGGVGLFATSVDGTLQAGAAMTAVHLQGTGPDGAQYVFDVLLDDHFLVTPTGEDTEDFFVVGSKGPYKVSGRLAGAGQIVGQSPLTVMFDISGTLCLQK